ncbi:hypothetical protein EJB05_53899, partial [Eragrostis curvula]
SFGFNRYKSIARSTLANTGPRMEALAFGRTCLDLARTIVEGYPYDFIDVVVGYRYDLNFLDVFHVYGAKFFASITSESRVSNSRRPIAYHVFPRTFSLFHQVKHFGADKNLTDVTSVVVYISDVHDTKCTWRRPSRHVAIMNTCMQILVIHVRSPHILRHVGEWRPAAQYFLRIAALHVQMNTRRGVLITTRYSKIIFKPNRPEAEAMRGFQTRLTNAPHQARQLGRDRLKDMNVL